MTPEAMIDLLDRQLEKKGEEIRLQRLVLGPDNIQIVVDEVTLMAFVRGYAPDEISPGSGITQQDLKLIFSPTEIIRQNWPGGTPAEGDKRIPIKGDVVYTTRGKLTVRDGGGLYAANTLVRIECQARGTPNG